MALKLIQYDCFSLLPGLLCFAFVLILYLAYLGVLYQEGCFFTVWQIAGNISPQNLKVF